MVKDEIDPDFLGLRKKPWNNSTTLPVHPETEETFERKMIKVLSKFQKNIIILMKNNRLNWDYLMMLNLNILNLKYT